jgi:hypothetical protein
VAARELRPSDVFWKFSTGRTRAKPRVKAKTGGLLSPVPRPWVLMNSGIGRASMNGFCVLGQFSGSRLLNARRAFSRGVVGSFDTAVGA